MSEGAIDLAALLAEARAARDPAVFTRAIPYARFLGLSFAVEGGELVGRMEPTPDHVGDSSITALHGGTTAALLESTAIFAALFGADEIAAMPRTITLTIDYLRSGKLATTECRASVVRRGRRILVVESRATQGDLDKPIATAIVHILVG